MPRRALIEHRPWLLAGIVATCAYYFLWNNPIGGVWLIALKGASVGFLAIYALRRGHGVDGALLALALALSAVGTMAVELYFRPGWTLFALSHIVATVLFLRNRKPDPSLNRKALALGLLVATPLATWLLTGAVSATIYASVLGVMAATAWASLFARRHVGAGVLVLVSGKLLAFSRISGFDMGELPELLGWPLYYAGLLAIATGVVQTLRRELFEN